MTRSGAGNRFRTRKLSTKQSLAVLRENQIDSVDDDAQRNIPQIETGVERQEEIEHHLQAAISASQAAAVGAKVTQIFIPTPDASEIPIKRYECLYPKKFSQPASYIRFSSTVEDCSGTAYCMSTEDEKYLEKLNSMRRSGVPVCTEDQFEFIMDQFENIIQLRQPFLSMDVSNIMSWEDMESSFTGAMDGHLKLFAKSIYSYWKDQKIARGGRPIIPVLKFEQGNEKDDGDPYVCFRRREVRQVRKTRRTDAQSTDKLKKLRQDLDTARNLVKDVLQRETMRKNSFAFEHSIFETRRQLIEFKRKAGIKGDDEDLVNHKKRRPVEQVAPPAIRLPVRQDGKPPEAELRQLSAVKAEAERSRHERYNQLRSSRLVPKHGVVDFTDEILFSTSRPLPVDPSVKFCGVQTYYLPSPPPSSASSVSSPMANLPTIDETKRNVSIVQASPQKVPFRDIPSFRRRRGRGGRTVVDRRGPAFAPSEDADPIVLDRVKYDEDEEDAYPPIYRLDPNGKLNIQFRARMLSPPPELAHINVHAHSMRRSAMSSPITHGPLASSVHQAPVSSPQHVMNGQQAMMMNPQQSPRFALHQMLNGQHPNLNPLNAMPQVTVNGHASPPNFARR
ncbi:Enhancer of polycomb-like protein 1 [Rhizina undulata]